MTCSTITAPSKGCSTPPGRNGSTARRGPGRPLASSRAERRTGQMMLTTTDVVRLAHSRPWASKPWSAELLEVFPDRLERAADRWRRAIGRAQLEEVGRASE